MDLFDQLYMLVGHSSNMKRSMKCCATELEALEVVWSIKNFQDGHQCIVYTDHKLLRSLLNTSHPSRKLAR